MELNNDFEVKAPVGATWAVLTDVEKIAPCLPGAQLQEIDGEGPGRTDREAHATLHS